MTSSPPPQDPNQGFTPPPPPPPPGGPGGYGGPGGPGGPGGYGGPGGPGGPEYGGPGYGGPPAAPPWDVGTALSYGWAKFQANAGQIILAAIALLVALTVVGGIGIGLAALLTSSRECTVDQAGNLTCTNGTGLVVGLIVNALVVALLLVALQIIGAGIIRGALDITEGRAFQAATIIKVDRIGAVVVTSLLIAAATFVGTILCYLPGLVVGFVTSYSLYFVMDRGLAPVEAIKASFELVTANIANTLIWYVVGAIVAGIGFLLCGIGALVSVPVVLIGTAYTYKRLTGQPVAA